MQWPNWWDKRRKDAKLEAFSCSLHLSPSRPLTKACPHLFLTKSFIWDFLQGGGRGGNSERTPRTDRYKKEVGQDPMIKVISYFLPTIGLINWGHHFKDHLKVVLGLICKIKICHHYSHRSMHYKAGGLRRTSNIMILKPSPYYCWWQVLNLAPFFLQISDNSFQ